MSDNTFEQNDQRSRTRTKQERCQRRITSENYTLIADSNYLCKTNLRRKTMLNSVSRRISLGALLLVVGTMFALTANAEIKWEKSLKDGMKKAEETGKLVMLDFYTDW